MAAYVVKLKEKDAFWAEAEDSAWTDDISLAKVYSEVEEAETALEEEIPSYYELVVANLDEFSESRGE